jgi:hypothetical protein
MRIFQATTTPDPGHHFPEVTMQIFDNATGTGVPDMSGFAKAMVLCQDATLANLIT